MTNEPTFWALSVLLPKTSLHDEFAKKLTTVVSSQRQSLRGVNKSALDKQDAATTWLLECLYQGFCCLPSAAVAIPRSTAAYSSGRPDALPYGYDTVSRVLDAAVSLGWVSIAPGFQSATPGESQVTRVHPTGDLLQQFVDLGVQWQELIAPPPDGLVILAMEKHGKDRRIVDRSEGVQVASMQDNLHRINEFLLTQCIHLNCSDDLLLDTVDGVVRQPDSSRVGGDGAIKDRPKAVNFQDVTMCRIFAHGSLGKGGRFYRGWWQHIRSEYRERILIGDHRTVECDYSGMALVCLYAREGQTLDPGDAYDIGLDYAGSGDPRRKVVKRYVNAIINDAEGRFRIDKASLLLLGLTAKELRKRVDHRHRKIKHMFRTGVGLELQYVDSKIAEQVMLRFVEMGEVCLPVHDSFIVRRGLEKRLLAVMQEEFQRETGTTTAINPTVGLPVEGLGTLSDANLRPPGMSGTDAIARMMTVHLNSHSICMSYLNSWLEQTQSEHDRQCMDVAVDEMFQWGKERPRA
jgi:hypothetical protein